MLSSHFESILLEYKQSITAKKMGEALVGRLNVDVLSFPNLMTPKLEKAFQTMEKIDTQVTDFNNRKDKNEIPAEELTKLQPKIQKAQEQYKILENQIAVHILEKLEAADPTNNKGYVQWLARLYINGETSLEDIESTVADYLDKFHKLKVKRHLANADVGQYKDFDAFMNDMDQYPNDVLDDDEAKNKTYKADKIYDENGVLVIHPKDKEAACRYGRGTRWCTASTRGHNYFASYNRRGPLYIFVPRKPDHPGEKYQFHFEDNVVADETDAYLDQDQLIRLVNRYPALKDAFQPQAEKHGLIYLQKPKRVLKGTNFKVEEYRKNEKPLYLMLGEMDVDGEYGKQDIYMLWKTDPDDANYQIKKVGNSRYSDDTTLNVLEQHKLVNKYPELITKFGLKTKNIKADPTRSQTKSGADVEMHDDTTILTDKQGHKTSIELEDPPSRGQNLLVKMQKTNPFKTRDKKEIRSEINPFEVTLQHPELIDKYSPIVNKKIKQMVRDHYGDAKEKKEFKEELYQKYAPLMPYKLYDKGDAIIKSHVTPDGKPILDYIIAKDDGKETNAITIVYRNQRDGNVDKIIQAEPEQLYDLSDEEDYNLRTPNGDIYGNAETESKYQRYYQRIGSALSDRSGRALPFLPSVAYIEKYPSLKELYKDTSLASPKTKEVSNATVKDFGKSKHETNNRSYYRNDWHDDIAKTMRNYIVQPKDAEQGESYAISWSPEVPQLTQIYHSASDGTQTKIENKQTKRHVLKSFPEIRALQIKDWDKFIKNNPEYDVKEHGAHSYSNNDNILQDWSFSPTEVVDNDRVIVSQFGPKQGDPFQLPSFEVFPKQKNPFGKVGDTFFIYLTLKDYRGKAGKISDIRIARVGKNTHHFVPVNKYGRTKNQKDENFVQSGVQLRENETNLDSKQIIDFFKYYPELRGMIKDENVHPKVPHPALAKQPEDSSENVQQMDGFKLEQQTTNDPNLDKYFIVPDEEKYPGEYYTLFEYHPLKTNPLGKSTNVFTDYGRPVAFNERGMIQLGVGEQTSSRYHHTKNDEMAAFVDSARGGEGSITPNTPLYNELMERFPELANYIAEKSKEIGDVRTQNLTEEDIVEIGQNRVYTFKNHDGSDCYYITPIENEVRRTNGEISDRHISSESERSMSQYQRTAHTLNPRKIASHEEDWEDDDHWNSGESYVINFESSESNPFLQVPLFIDPFRGVAELQVNAIEFDNDNKRYTASEVPQNKQFIIDKLSAVPQPNEENMNTASFTARNYLTRAKQNPELMRWLEQKAEEANAKTNGVGAFINFLPITTDQMTIDVPKIHGVDVVGIAKIGISNPLYLWQGRKDVFQNIEDRLLAGSENYYSRQESDNPDPYTQWANEFADSKDLAPKQEGGSIRGMSRFITESVAEGVVGLKPESGGKFLDYDSSRNVGKGITLTQIPDAKWITTGNQLLGLDKIAKPKELKQMGLSPTQMWSPRQVAKLPSPQITNKGKPWIHSIKEYKFPDGIGINASGYGNKLPQKVLGPGTGYLITLNPISDEPYRKRKDGKLVNMASPWHTATRAVRDLDLPWDFTHGVLDYSRGDFEKKNTMIIYFANNRVAYFLEPTYHGDFRQFNLSQEQKKKLFFDPETGLFPELKPIFDQYAKSNKWLRENKWHHMLSKVLFESLGDKAYWELRKRQEKQNQNFSQLVWLDNVRLTGSYSNDKLKELGFFLKNGKWAIQKPKFDRLIRDGKLKETVLRPLKTGTNRIPKTGKKKIQENVWAFDAEKALELLKEPLLRGGDNDDVDLSCEVCQGHGCGSGYDIKDDLQRWKDMLIPDAESKPEHLTNEYIEARVKKLEALIKKFPNGIPDNIDCTAGMSNMKHREYQKNKSHDAEDVLYNIIGDDGLFDDMSELDEDDDVRPLIMNWLNPEWRAKQRPGLPEYPLVADVDFADLYKRARKIYNPLRVVKEGKKLPRTSEFLHVKQELEDLKRLSGVYERYQIPVTVEGATSAYSGSNISKTANEIAKIMKEKDIQPGTPEWFQLWFALPKLTGEKPTGDIK